MAAASSSYNTRSTKTTVADSAPGTTASSITIEPRSSSTAINMAQPRHYCIALTNNPRMLRGQAQALRNDAATTTTSTTRQRTTSDTRQETSLPPLPPTVSTLRRQPSVLESRCRIRPLGATTRSRSAQQQVVPTSTQPIQESMAATERRTYEQEIEEDFKVQIQPLLQNYLNKTKRSPPVNLFLNMSSMIQF